MYSRRFKAGYFLLEGLNSFATVFFFYYFYFFMQVQFGFGNRANLMLAAVNGAVYALFSWLAGRFAQRLGYFAALKLGFAVMVLAMIAGACCHTQSLLIAAMVLSVTGMCFTWPTLEALVTEGESPAGVQHYVGIYNIVWAGTGAVAYFLGGAILDKCGFRSLFLLPLVIQIGQLTLTLWLEAHARRRSAHPGGPLPETVPAPAPPPSPAPSSSFPPRPNPRRFLRMAWLANPFAYIAINTLIAVMPGLARRLDLSTTLAGFYGSLWCFSRVAAFIGLWLWPGWHYRFRWMLSAYLLLLATFALMLMVPNLAVLLLAQLVFGLAIGLIYYSSLFYSMDVGDTKGEHGGIHEAAIGLGNFAGPAVGAASLFFLPQAANSGALAVSGLLLLGLGGLLAVWRRAS